MRAPVAVRAAALGLAAVVCAGCDGPPATPVAPAAASPSRGPEISLPAPGAVDEGPFRPLTGPADPQIGVEYPYDLLTHCGVRWARFGNREWVPPQPLPEPVPATGPDGRNTGYTRGTMTLLARDRARFAVDGTGVEIDFAPAAVAPPPCA